MRPAYESEVATLYCGDARDVLPTLNAESVDCVITDPPYGVEWRSGRRLSPFAQMAGDDGSVGDLLGEITPPLVRATRRRRHLYTFGVELCHDLLPQSGKAQLIWDKCRVGAGDLRSVWGPSFETIFFHVRVPSRGNDGEGGLTARLRRQRVIRVPRLNATQVRRHPTEKPVRLLRELVESSTLMEDTVLDPFAGSGSTGVAALLAGRRTILIEVDEHYAALAAERIATTEKIVREMATA